MSSLPLGFNHIPIRRALTTTAAAIFVPFTTQELFMGGESLYYGLNALSNNIIMVDRKKLKNPNGLILGTPGSGQILRGKAGNNQCVFRNAGRYYHRRPGRGIFPAGSCVGRTGHPHFCHQPRLYQPMDINMDYSDDDNPLGVKSDFILSLCELIMGSRNGIEAEEKSVIDRCLPLGVPEIL